MILPNIKLSIFILIFILIHVSGESFPQTTTSHAEAYFIIGKLDSTEKVKEVLLNSSPQDAYVFYKDSLIGNTPLFVQSIFKNVTLRKNGYDDINILFSDITPGKIFSMNYNGQEKEKSFFEKDIFKILTAGIVVLGATTAYFKLKADNKFEEYEFSGNSRLLDETRKYDLISGITFTALQINFGFLLYYFLIE
jgi:hypothetical protein